MIEMKVFKTGKTQVRLMGTELKSKVFLQCSLAILNRTRFKKFKNGRIVTRVYRFFCIIDSKFSQIKTSTLFILNKLSFFIF